MPVGTVGSVKAIAPDDLAAIGAPIILGNTYHLYLRPGDELVARHGGLHGFCLLARRHPHRQRRLPGLQPEFPAQDPGGRRGVPFPSGRLQHLFTPESVVGIQRNLNSDIMMVLDECVPYGADYAYTEKSLALTTRWALRARAAYPQGSGQNLLFAITQGGFFKDLRKRSIEELCCHDFDGFAIGGLSVGESKHMLYDFMYEVAPQLPKDKPRYLMGVGTPLDIAHGINAGIDMFDCVLPTRNARNGTLYTSLGKVNIKRKEYAEDDSPLDPACNCYTCRTFSRAYLRHLYVSKELLAFRLNSLHNLTYFLNVVRQARQAILEDRYASFLAHMESLYPDEAAQGRGL